jgi:hypothetical protein
MAEIGPTSGPTWRLSHFRRAKLAEVGAAAVLAPERKIHSAQGWPKLCELAHILTEIHIRGLELAQNLGQPCEYYVLGAPNQFSRF